MNVNDALNKNKFSVPMTISNRRRRAIQLTAGGKLRNHPRNVNVRSLIWNINDRSFFESPSNPDDFFLFLYIYRFVKVNCQCSFFHGRFRKIFPGFILMWMRRKERERQWWWWFIIDEDLIWECVWKSSWTVDSLMRNRMDWSANWDSRESRNNETLDWKRSNYLYMQHRENE